MRESLTRQMSGRATIRPLANGLDSKDAKVADIEATRANRLFSWRIS